MLSTPQIVITFFFFFYQQLTQSHGLGKQIKEHRSPPLRLDQGDCISNCWVWHNSLEHQLTSDLYKEIPRQAYRGVWPYVLIVSNNRTNCWKTGKTTIWILVRRFRLWLKNVIRVVPILSQMLFYQFKCNFAESQKFANICEKC